MRRFLAAKDSFGNLDGVGPSTFYFLVCVWSPHTSFANQRLNAKYILFHTLTYNHICAALIVPFPRFAWYCCTYRMACKRTKQKTKQKNTWHFVFAPFACSIFRFNRNFKHISQIGSLASSTVCISRYLFFSFFSFFFFTSSLFPYRSSVIWKSFRRQRWREIRDEIDQWCVNQTM